MVIFCSNGIVRRRFLVPVACHLGIFVGIRVVVASRRGFFVAFGALEDVEDGDAGDCDDGQAANDAAGYYGSVVGGAAFGLGPSTAIARAAVAVGGWWC